MRNMHKMATQTSGNSSHFDSCGESVCNKGSSTIGYRANWCVSHCLQPKQFVGRPVEEEEEEKEKNGEIRGLTDFHV